MSNGGDLLRMLMPAVRPVPTEGVRPGRAPIESQSFDTLLQEAGQAQPSQGLSTDPAAPTDPTKQADAAQATADTTKTDSLAPLAGLDSIHNASLRRIIAEAGG